MKTLNVGLIGYKFMGKAHSQAFKGLKMFFDPGVEVVMKAICGRDRQAVSEAADRFGWEGYETNWRKLVARDDIDTVAGSIRECTRPCWRPGRNTEGRQPT